MRVSVVVMVAGVLLGVSSASAQCDRKNDPDCVIYKLTDEKAFRKSIEDSVKTATAPQPQDELRQCRADAIIRSENAMKNAIKAFNEDQDAKARYRASNEGRANPVKPINEPQDELTKLRHENEVLKNWLAQSNTVTFVLNEMINQYEGWPASRLVSLHERVAEIYGQGLIREDAK